MLHGIQFLFDACSVKNGAYIRYITCVKLQYCQFDAIGSMKLGKGLARLNYRRPERVHVHIRALCSVVSTRSHPRIV